MKFLSMTKINAFLVTALATSSAFAQNEEITAVKAIENIGSVANASGEALYSIMLVAGILIYILCLGAWWVSQKPNNQTNISGKGIFVGVVIATALTFGGGALGGFGELFGISDADDRINYSSLSSQTNN